MRLEQDMIEDDIIDIVYFARISWYDAWTLSNKQRLRIAKRILKHKQAESGSKEQILGE